MSKPDDRHHAIADAMREREAEPIDLHRRLVQVPSINRGNGSSADEPRVSAKAVSGPREARGRREEEAI